MSKPKKVSALDPQNARREFDVYGEPDTCPVCHMATEPLQITDPRQRYDPDNRKVQIIDFVYRCPRHRCGAMFIAEYRESKAAGIWMCTGYHPSALVAPTFPQGVEETSAAFVKIFTQAAQAEVLGLDEISGIGYRKALEFLIKDYCIKQHPTKEDDIKKAYLATCIADYVRDANINACASRATWLGNDEAHYERVWTSHDINDLKILLQLTQHWISNEHLTTKYKGTILKGKEPAKSDVATTQSSSQSA